MPRGRYPVARTRRSAKRKTVWVGTSTTVSVTVGAGLSVIHSSFDPQALAMLAPTVVRTRGIATFTPSAFGADSRIDGAFGLGIVSDEAFAAGAASLPRPFDDDDWPGWLVHGYWQSRVEFQSATSEVFIPHTHVIDSKAMRKIGPGETLVWVMEDNASISTQAMISARVLMLLS